MYHKVQRFNPRVSIPGIDWLRVGGSGESRATVILAVETLGNFLAFNFAPPHPDLYVNPTEICSLIANHTQCRTQYREIVFTIYL